MTTAATSALPPRLHAPLWLLALVTFSGTLAMHVFVPALPIAAKSLGAGMGAMQMTVSLYILGLAVGQLVYGPLADRYGRRPVLLIGLGIYCVSGLAAAVAPEVHSLIAARLFQAIGGCAAVRIMRREFSHEFQVITHALQVIPGFNINGRSAFNQVFD